MANTFQNNSKKSEAGIPPQNIEAEKSLLGCLMLDKKAIFKVADFLASEDFYKKTHQEIYQAIEDLFAKGEPLDLLSVSNNLEEKGKLKEVGGSAYLTDLINSVPNALHILTYAKIVQKKRILRDLIQTSYEIGQMGYDEDEDIDTLLDQAERSIFGIAQKSLNQKFVSIKEELEDAFERIDKLSKNQGELRGLSTGFRDLDNILAGFQKGDLIILASRPSLGKSALAVDIARHCAVNQGMSIGMFSLEMSKDQIVDRLISAQSGVDLWRLRTGRLSDSDGNNDFQKIQNTFDSLSKAPIFIDDSSYCNILQMKSMARRLQANNDLKLIIVDYLQLMEPRNANVPMVQQMTEISRSLKGLAKELNLPVLALSQLSRAVEQRSPQIPRLSDLRETGAIEQDADVVLFIHREDKYRENTDRKNIADIIIAKHRNGPVGKIELYFDEQRVSFHTLEKHEEQFEGEDFQI